LHLKEKQHIRELAGKDEVKEARLTAAACAMVKCYAEYPEDSAAYQHFKQIAEFGASDALADERRILSKQDGLFGYTASSLFSDANIDAAKQWNNTYQFTARGAGAAQATLGVVGVAGAVASAPITCTTGLGCAANAFVAGTSADVLIAGVKQTMSGQPEATYLNQALTGLGLSPGAASLLEAGLGSAVTAGGVVNAITDRAAALNKLGAAQQMQETARNVIIQAGEGKFGPTGQLAGQQVGSTVVDTVVGAEAGKAVTAVKGRAALAPNGTNYTYDAMNPGPLPDRVAGTFAGGRYSVETVQASDTVFFRAGDASNPGGSFFSFKMPQSVAQTRIDNAVKPYWIDPLNGATTGTSPINSAISAQFPVGTTYYYGPVGTQGGIYLGGQDSIQIFIPNARAIGTFTPTKSLK
jgi:hypothetical protein